MEDYSNLKGGGVAAASVPERVWGVPKKRKSEDGKRDNRSGSGRKGTEEEKGKEKVMDAGEHPESEELGYGSRGLCRKRNAQVDVVI